MKEGNRFHIARLVPTPGTVDCIFSDSDLIHAAQELPAGLRVLVELGAGAHRAFQRIHAAMG